MNCARCSSPLTGRQVKWCSEGCRKRAFDEARRTACIVCGSALGEKSSYDATERCHACDAKRRRAELDARVTRVAEMYNAGASTRAIADDLGWTNAGRLIHLARQRGLIGYRHQVAA